MPGANEVFGCPPTKKIFLRTNSCQTFLTTFFHFPKFYQDFSCSFRKLSPENSDDLILVISPNFPDAPLSWMPGAVLHFLRIYPYFFNIYLSISSENSLVGCPGRRTPPHTPLHATGSSRHVGTLAKSFTYGCL